MPRPRVPPNQRQRASEACQACRDAKKRCSGTAPCTHCMRRGMVDSCVITHQRRGQRLSIARANAFEASVSANNPNAAPGTTDTPRPREASGSISGPTIAGATSMQGSGDGGRSLQSPPPSLSAAPSEDAASTRMLDEASGGPADANSAGAATLKGPSSRMLLNLRGERVYIGEGGNLSFLQLVRGIVSDRIGPSQFSRSGGDDRMLEKESPVAQTSSPSISIITNEERSNCIQYYYAVTGGLLELFLPGELESLFGSPESHRGGQMALANLIMAIGIQCSPSTDSHDRELSFFREAQLQAFSGMLEDPDIDMIRTFLLMSFYLLGECRRNTAFLYLGIATRAAVALGLHSKETYANMNDQKNQLRLRVWMSLRVLDVIVNSLLGRPVATTGIVSNVDDLVDNMTSSTKDSGLSCLSSSFKLVGIMASIVHELYEKKVITIPVIEEYLQKLENWSQELPEFVRAVPEGASPLSSFDKASVGKVHVSCFYYLAVTLVTRPIFISTLSQHAASGLVHSQLAAACIDAAMFIVQTCVGAQNASLMQSNMCLLKAIIFLSGLVLGFETFAKGTVDYAVESAFRGSQELLGFIGIKSPQAALYRDILSSLSNAIANHREGAIAKGRSSYVSRIFNFDRNQGGFNPTADPRMTDDAAGVDSPRIQMQMSDLVASWSSFGQNTPMNGGDMLLDWDSLDISQWDNFPYTA